MTYKRVIRGTGDKRRQIAVEKTGHPAAFRKLRCPACSIGYAVESNTNKGKYVCSRCGAEWGNRPL
jgi:transcription elongation factor Elf1